MKAKYLAVSLLTALFGLATPAVADFDAIDWRAAIQ